MSNIPSCPCCGAQEPDWNASRATENWFGENERISALWIAETRENERLREAKRAALKVADERSLENVGLRAANENLRAALRKIRTKADAGHVTENNLNQIGNIADEALELGAHLELGRRDMAGRPLHRRRPR